MHSPWIVLSALSSSPPSLGRRRSSILLLPLHHLLLLQLAHGPAPASSHFTLQTPPSIGYSDMQEGTAPCGGFDIKSRPSSSVTDWPVAGHPIGIISTHPEAHWEIRFALLNETDNLRFLVPPIVQTGLGAFCLPSVPAPSLAPSTSSLVGLDAVVQVIQSAVDGNLYQCAAIKFVDGAAVVPQRDTCRNSSGVSASFVGGGAATPSPGGGNTAATGSSQTPSSSTGGSMRSLSSENALLRLISLLGGGGGGATAVALASFGLWFL